MYREGGSTNRNPPLSIFDRGLDVYLIQREKIRTNIISEKESYKSIYNEIYTNAKNGSTSTNCESTVCGIAKLAKDAAFIYLMGFDENGANLDGVGDPGRQYFYDKARDILKKDEDNYGSFLFKEDQQYRAKELMNLLQAHDYLNTAKLAGITSYPDYDDVREELADFTYDLYGSANNIWGSLDAYNNLTLIVASSIGMAACVLSDKGTYFWRVQKNLSDGLMLLMLISIELYGQALVILAALYEGLQVRWLKITETVQIVFLDMQKVLVILITVLKVFCHFSLPIKIL